MLSNAAFAMPYTSLQYSDGTVKDRLGEDLLTRFNEAIEDLSSREAAKVTGISHTQIIGIREGKVREPRPATKRLIRTYLDKRKESEGNGRELGPISEEAASVALRVIADVTSRLQELRIFWEAQLELAKATPPASSASAGAVAEVQTKPLRNAGRVVLKRARQEKAKGRESARGSRSAPDAEVAG